MKNKFQFLVGLMLSISLFSCNYTEQIIIKKDGSGKINLTTDASKMMELAAGLDDTSEGDARIDSVMVMKDILNDEELQRYSEADRALLEELSLYTSRFLYDKEEEIMEIDMYKDFKNVSEIKDLFKVYDKLMLLKPEDEDEAETGETATMPLKNLPYKTAYSFKGKTFIRKTTITDSVAYKEQLEKASAQSMYYASSTYGIAYTFPHKIRSTSKDDKIKLSKNKKTLFYEVSIKSYMKDPSILDIKVELKR